MDSTLPILSLSAAAAVSAAAVFPKLKARLALSRAKHRSLTGHSKMSKMVARLLPHYEFDIDDFFRSDGAPADVALQRQDAFFRLASLYQARYAKGRQMTAEAATRISDLQFTENYRVPFQYSRLVRENLGTGAFVESSSGVTVTDIDGNVSYDLTGSYGVNIFGNDFYKECITAAEKRAQALGPVLGPYHPVITDNVQRLCEISGLDEVSFHMSGTEAVMQAVRLARYHTKRSHLVRFAGAYHGWWGDVQPGVGNPVSPHETYTLADMSERTLHVLRTRKDIACVLVNPLQALHPNANAPGDSALVDSSRKGAFDRAAYTEWLKKLREVCTERGIVLIFDEVFVGFRLAAGGAQEYFGVRADMVTYGKSLAGGLPGRRGLRHQGSDAALSRRPPRRRLLRPRHLQFASVRDDGDGRVPLAPRQPELQRGLSGPRRHLERPRRRAQHAARRRRFAGPGQQSLVDLDGAIYRTVPLQLDAAILSPRRRPGLELGRHRPADFQPELHRRGFFRSRRPLRRRQREDEARRLVVA